MSRRKQAKPRALRRHLIAVHHKTFDNVCKLCNESFTLAKNLKRHMHRVHAVGKNGSPMNSIMGCEASSSASQSPECEETQDLPGSNENGGRESPLAAASCHDDSSQFGVKEQSSCSTEDDLTQEEATTSETSL